MWLVVIHERNDHTGLTADVIELCNGDDVLNVIRAYFGTAGVKEAWATTDEEQAYRSAKTFNQQYYAS